MGEAPESQVSQLRRALGHPCFTISQENPAVEMFIRHRLPESSSSILQSCLRIFTELTAPETCTFSPLVAITDSLFCASRRDATCSWTRWNGSADDIDL